MLSIKKNNVVNLNIYTSVPRLEEYFPIDHTKKLIPDWFKTLPSYIEPSHKSTLKVCPGITEFFNLGVTVPLWCDHTFEYNNGELIDVKTPMPNHNPGYSHPSYQWGEKFPKWTHLKLSNPWFFETDRLVNFIVIQATWNMEDFNHYTIPPGAIEFKYQHHCHLQMFFPPGHGKLELEAGTPMIHIIPLEDVKLKINFNQFDQSSYNRIAKNHKFTFDNIYYKTRKLFKSMGK